MNYAKQNETIFFRLVLCNNQTHREHLDTFFEALVATAQGLEQESLPMKPLDLDALFQQLLYHRDKTADITSLGPWLRQQVTTQPFPDLSHIPFKTSTYTRNHVAREVTHRHHKFEALIMRWDKQVKTSIHGHPAFAFYHVISGLFEMELFSYTRAHGLQLKETRCFRASDTIWFWGQPGRYDNFIHRVTCLESGLTFHIYSEDAQKGTGFCR